MGVLLCLKMIIDYYMFKMIIFATKSSETSKTIPFYKIDENDCNTNIKYRY